MSFNFSEVADRIVEIQAKIDEIEAAAAAKTKDLKAEVKELEEQLQLAMADAGLTAVKGAKSEAVLKESLRVGFQDFEAFEKFCLRKKALHLFERRIASTAYREMKESLGGKPIPGLTEFIQTKVKVSPAKRR
jgi:hypothetical protein